METFDTIVIGGGKAGKTLAMDLGRQGVRVALIEADPEMLGGTCVNVGCIPTKSFVAAARLARAARAASDFGVEVGEVEVNWPALRRRVEAVVAEMRAINARNFRAAAPGMEFIIGRGRFTGPREVEVTLPGGARRRLGASRVFINTGARPAWPDLPGLAEVGDRALTSITVQRLDAPPDHLIVLGGGYVALEFAQIFRDLGSRVTVVARSALLPREDPDVVQELQRLLEAEGVEFLTGRTVERLSRDGDEIRVALRNGTAGETRSGSHVLVALGRAPVTEDLNLGVAGVATDARGFIQVNDRLETSAPGVWALGDVNGGPQFTHVSLDDYRIVKANVYGNGGRSREGRIFASTIFTEPELAHVGVTEKQARAAGRRVLLARTSAATIARAGTSGRRTGLLKAVVDANTKRILGCTLLASEAGEMIGTVQMAMLGGLPYTAVRDAVISHPTMTEGLGDLFAAIREPDSAI